MTTRTYTETEWNALTLKERLREGASDLCCPECCYGESMRLAATALDSRDARIAELIAERDDAREQRRKWHDASVADRADAHAAKARITDLEGLLGEVEGTLERVVVQMEDGESHNEGAFDESCDTCVMLKELRATLGKLKAAAREGKDG